MNLSDAVVLGSTILNPMAGCFSSGPVGGKSTHGCALGMAIEATGIAKGFKFLMDEWPWLDKTIKLPCECTAWCQDILTGAGVIVHLFDCHVMQIDCYVIQMFGSGDPSITSFSKWTFEQLVEWIRSVEPKEDTCKKLTSVSSVDTHQGSTLTLEPILDVVA